MIIPHAALLLPLSLAVGAPRDTAVTEAVACQGQRITDIRLRGNQRPLLSDRFAALGRLVNWSATSLQRATNPQVIRRFLLLAPGDRCNEQARAESERILRAQPFISAAAVRAVPSGPDAVALEVETTDEYLLFFQSWGWRGLPAGMEVGTGHIAGSGRSFRTLVELGRGNEIGWGARVGDQQFLGRPLLFQAAVSSRPFADGFSMSVTRPWYTNFQRDTWSVSVSDESWLFWFRDPVVRDISLDYRRALIQGSWTRRLGAVNDPFVVGASIERELADKRRVVQIREAGAVPVPTPLPLARYRRYDAARLGVSGGVRLLRFVPQRALGALSATEDVALGVQGGLGVRLGIGALQTDPTDAILNVSTSGAWGGVHSLLRWGIGSEFVSARPGSIPAQSQVGGRITWTARATESHLSTLRASLDVSRNARLPVQHTFRDFDSGLIGYRSSDLGGAQRAIVGVEQRLRLWSPLRTVEWGVAALAQSGRLWAGDAPYGVDTGWRTGVGGALLVAIPAGSRQTLRIEVGAPLHPFPGLQRREFRLVHSDFPGRF